MLSASNISSILDRPVCARDCIVLLNAGRHIANISTESNFRRAICGSDCASWTGQDRNITDTVLLYCYHYDPRAGKYGAVISNVLR